MPPTDPRILSMTPEQIELEFTHMIIDKRLQDEAEGNQVYVDDEYEKYDEETDENDNMLSDFVGLPQSTEGLQDNDEDWIDEDYNE